MNGDEQNWYKDLGLGDESVGVIQTKGWGDVESIIKSYRELEKFSGQDKNEFIKIPKATDGEEVDYSEIYTKLGRPEKAEDYELSDSEFSKAARETLFKAGLSNKQAKMLEDWVTKYTEDFQKAESEKRASELDLKAKTGLENLKKEWGNDFEKNRTLAQSAVKKYGFTDEQIDAIGDAIGSDVFSKMMLALSDHTDDTVLTGYKSGGSETKEMAALKISEMQNDPETMKKLAAGDPKVTDELMRLAALTAQ